MEQPYFASVQDYGQRFTDPDYWRPYVEAVCGRHGLSPCSHIQPGLPGTFPVFIVDDRYIVKFFGELFQGPRCFAVERDLYTLLGTSQELPTPTLLSHGYLFPESQLWQWPYLVSSRVVGTSLGEVAAQVSYDDKQSLVRELGPVVRHIHALQVKHAHFLSPTWDRFLHFLDKQRATCTANHTQWAGMPARLVDAIDEYLPPVEVLVDQRTTPHLLHCDLNADHVFGRFEREHWRLTGIIDFGDAMVGDRIYELVALHIGLGHCDKQLLRIFLASYGFDSGLQEQFVLRAMSYTLLHEFAVLNQLFSEYPAARTIKNLEELAILLWHPEHPGLA